MLKIDGRDKPLRSAVKRFGCILGNSLCGVEPIPEQVVIALGAERVCGVALELSVEWSRTAAGKSELLEPYKSTKGKKHKEAERLTVGFILSLCRK